MRGFFKWKTLKKDDEIFLNGEKKDEPNDLVYKEEFTKLLNYLLTGR